MKDINIERLENLPQKESCKDSLTRRFGNMWNTRFDHTWHRSDKSDYYWVKAERVIKKYLGKSVDEAFSYYCTLVELHEQSEFFSTFNTTLNLTQPHTIDSNGNIQINPNAWKRKKGVVRFFSADFESGFKHVKTGEIVSLNRTNNRGAWYYNQYKDWTSIIILGYSKEFESKNDKEYKRLMAEKIQKVKKLQKLKKLQEQEFADNLLKTIEAERKESQS